MKTTVLLTAAALSLASCQTSGSIDTAIQTNLPKTCNLIDTAHAAFVAASVSGNIKPATVRKENAAYEAVQVICDDPSSVTAANALVLVATAYATISLALKEAKNVEG